MAARVESEVAAPMGTEAEVHPLPVAPGDVVAGKYVVVRVIGRGGMGSVFEAKHRALGQRVAIKMLHAQDAGHEEAVERFLREARAAASLTSDHVVRVFDVGTHDTGLPFMVMELLEGDDLGELIERRGAVPVAEAVRWVLQAAEAVAEAHEAGIVHRDLKPSNLFLVRPSSVNRSARVKVVDFGISKQGNLPAGSVQTLTGPRSVMGSPSYMSPEQVRSTKSVDARTDVWSLGVILYELLTGRTAFDGESLGDVFAKIREESLPPIRQVRPGVPASLEAILDRCLRRDRDQRFADAAELAEALRAVAQEGTVDDRPSGGGALRASGTGGGMSQATTAFELLPASRPGPPSSTHAPWISARRAGPRRRMRWLVAVAGGAAVAGLVALMIVRGGEPPPVSTPATPATDGVPLRVAIEPAGPEVVPAVAPPIDDTPAPGTATARLQPPPRSPPQVAAPSSSPRGTPPRPPSGADTRSAPAAPGPSVVAPSTRLPAPRTGGGDPDDLGI